MAGVMERAGRRARANKRSAPPPHHDRQRGGEGGIGRAHLLEPSARPRQGVSDRRWGGKSLVKARRVLGDVIGGGGEMVEPPIVTNSMPFTVVPSPRGEGSAPEGHDVPVLIVRVPYMEEKGEDG